MVYSDYTEYWLKDFTELFSPLFEVKYACLNSWEHCIYTHLQIGGEMVAHTESQLLLYALLRAIGDVKKTCQKTKTLLGWGGWTLSLPLLLIMCFHLNLTDVAACIFRTGACVTGDFLVCVLNISDRIKTYKRVQTDAVFIRHTKWCTFLAQAPFQATNK